MKWDWVVVERWFVAVDVKTRSMQHCLPHPFMYDDDLACRIPRHYQ